ncbi:hypothetical protein SAMN04488058_101336 [Deinococcus reticulitermitis]|uniref:Uncharacterized protein n=1 Tax=Deinococcus reticulitermitis TaxID=856736 RepID=A0A1H6SRP1_9DEIO|nr:hypothetical protein [Deinococcus reticulitermitis]SEI68474.1 hypothetical protein SAMN04488058_101336 [Deinococcus reticulitermitis]
MTYRPAVYCVNPGCHEPYRAELPACPECDTPTRPPLSRMSDAEWTAFVADCLDRLNRWGFQPREVQVHEIAPNVLGVMGLGRVVVRRGGVVEHSWTFSDPQPLPPQPWQIDEAMTGRR